MSEQVTAIVSLTSSGSCEATPSKAVRDGIGQEVAGSFRIIWMPPKVTQTEGSGYSVASDILIFLSGVSLASVVKPIWEGVLKEVGKDIWGGIKRLICRVREEQAEATYNVAGSAFVVFELHDEHVLLQIPLPSVAKEDAQSRQELEQAVAERLKQLSDSWDSIQATIEKFDVGKKGGATSATGVHVIADVRGAGKLDIVSGQWPDERFRGTFLG